MLRTTLLIFLAGCLPAPAILAPLRPSELSLRCDAELTATRQASVGEPSARSGWSDDASWKALLLVTWHPPLPTSDVASVAPGIAENLDPGAFDDPVGSGNPWLLPSAGLPVQP
jgi:hypothetical protein